MAKVMIAGSGLRPRLNDRVALATRCIVCDEYVNLTPAEEEVVSHGKQIIKVCDPCKEAVKSIKENKKDRFQSILDSEIEKLKEGN